MKVRLLARSSPQQDVTALTTSLFFGVLVLPAVFFTLVYFPALKFSLVLVSPYTKADVRRRVFAAAIDGLFVTTCWVAYWNAGSLLFAGLAVLYLLCRDGVGGQSIGRFLVGQAVVYVDSGQRCGLRGSFARNLIFVLPGANLAAIVLETRTLMRDPQGQRLGDRLAHTQVVEGLGARDVVKNLQQWWASVLSDLPRAARRPDRVVIGR
jgi:hypothetical protein